ncbi:TetR/AcrR family transcriptional regulator [Desulfitobacterium sp. AusDCA]|uniref:TetR/AcrR family transcriptional regulator n=1 Tax=Desulfitobacterium sp. AusDCA TaxID=3240383 RepID=UPI003DA7404B
MYPKFYSLEPEKRERIINAALKEFTRSGYERASTNEIIKEANIAKGSLFSYFNNKKELYLFLLDYLLEIIDKIYAEVDWNETDLFKRIRDIAFIKFKIMKNFPKAFDFLKTVGHENAAEVKTEIDKMGKYIIDSGFERGYKNIDLTKFREDIDIQKTINIINWTLLSFAEQQADKLKSFNEIDMDPLREWEEYSDLMQRCFYKKEK